MRAPRGATSGFSCSRVAGAGPRLPAAGSSEQAPLGDDLGALEFEQPALAVEAAGVAGERPVGADDSVARHEDADRIAAHRAAHAPREVAIAEALGEIAVRDCLAERDLAQHRPHRVLELIADRREREVEADASPGEVLVEFDAESGEQLVAARVDLDAEGARGRRMPVPGEVEPDQPAVVEKRTRGLVSAAIIEDVPAIRPRG